MARTTSSLQRALVVTALLATAIVMAQLHFVVHRLEVLDDAVDRRLAAMEKQLRQQAAERGAARAQLGGALAGDAALLPRAAATAPKAPAPPATPAAGAAPLPSISQVAHRAHAPPMAPVARADPPLPIAREAPKATLPAGGPGCTGSAQAEPRVRWGGDMVDFGLPANDHLVRMHADGAVDAGRQYTKWDRWQWRQQCGDTMARVGVRVRPGADRSRIKYVRIWGERNSCTTMVTDVLSRNLELSCDGDASCVSGGLPHKHDFMRGANLHDHEETLNVHRTISVCSSAPARSAAM